MDKLASIISNISDLSKLSKPKYVLKTAKTSISKIIYEVQKEVLPFVEKREQTLEIALPQTDLIAEVDKDSIWQVLINLVLNAIRFTPNKGRIRIEGYLGIREIEIRVIDSGIVSQNQNLKTFLRVFMKSAKSHIIARVLQNLRQVA